MLLLNFNDFNLINYAIKMWYHVNSFLVSSQNQIFIQMHHLYIKVKVLLFKILMLKMLLTHLSISLHLKWTCLKVFWHDFHIYYSKCYWLFLLFFARVKLIDESHFTFFTHLNTITYVSSRIFAETFMFLVQILFLLVKRFF